MSAKHTPGPWYLEPSTFGGSVDLAVFSQTKAGCPRYICRVYGEGILSKTTNERDANARLIAKAPELKAALELAVATIERLTVGQPAKISSTQGTLQVAAAALEGLE